MQVKANNTNVYSGSGYTGSTTPYPVLSQNGLISVTMMTGATGRAAGFGMTFSAGCASVTDTTLATSYRCVCRRDRGCTCVCVRDRVREGVCVCVYGTES